MSSKKMNNRKSTNGPRHPPDNEGITLAVGAQLRISKAGLGILGGVIVIVVIAVLVWMDPSQAIDLLSVILNR